jgi:hypothetical protein
MKTLSCSYLRILSTLLLTIFSSYSPNLLAQAPTYSDVCSTTATTADPDRKARCEAAQNSFLDNYIQNLANQQAAYTVNSQNSATAAYFDTLTKIRTAMQPNTGTLATIKAQSRTVPDMEATAQAELARNASEQMRTAASKLASERLRCTANTERVILTNASSLQDTMRSYSAAKSALELMQDQVDAVLAEARNLPVPRKLTDTTETFRVPGGAASALTSIGLALDLVTNIAAVAAAFKPVITSTSNTLTDAPLTVAHEAYIEGLISKSFTVVDVKEVLPLPHASSEIRKASSQLLSKINELQLQTAKIAQYTYEAPKPTASTPSGTSTTSTASPKISPQQEYRDTVANAAKQIINSAQQLRARIFTDTQPSGSSTQATPALIKSFDQLEALDLMSAKSGACYFTLRFEPQTPIYDAYGKEGVFSSKYKTRVYGSTKVQITHISGRIMVNDSVLVDSGWVNFGP